MLEHSILVANDVPADVMSSSARGMDISETFRPEDLSKTDFFDFVTAAAPEMGTGNTTGNEPNTGNDQPLQGFDQVRQLFYNNFTIQKHDNNCDSK